MRGRNILEGFVILHETIHELHRKNQSGVIFKIDFETHIQEADRPVLLDFAGFLCFRQKCYDTKI